jgi:hypothetical protein
VSWLSSHSVFAGRHWISLSDFFLADVQEQQERFEGEEGVASQALLFLGREPHLAQALFVHQPRLAPLEERKFLLSRILSRLTRVLGDFLDPLLHDAEIRQEKEGVEKGHVPHRIDRSLFMRDPRILEVTYHL